MYEFGGHSVKHLQWSLRQQVEEGGLLTPSPADFCSTHSLCSLGFSKSSLFPLSFSHHFISYKVTYLYVPREHWCPEPYNWRSRMGSSEASLGSCSGWQGRR